MKDSWWTVLLRDARPFQSRKTNTFLSKINAKVLPHAVLSKGMAQGNTCVAKFFDWQPCCQKSSIFSLKIRNARPVGLALYGRSNRKSVGLPEAVPLRSVPPTSGIFNQYRVRELVLRLFQLNARYGGAGQRAPWPLSRGRARACGAAIRPNRHRQHMSRVWLDYSCSFRSMAVPSSLLMT
eukprot:6179403-Pleurochrysis_carterae.AAC.1